MSEPKPTTVVPEAVRQLLEQRGTYREWLSRLDEVGGKYRTAVAERVRDDYRARLEAVGEQLTEHRHELVASLERRRERLDELSAAFERHSAELEEAELRFQVGEFDDTTWEETRAGQTEKLGAIDGELGEARAAVGELERVLGELGGGLTAADDAEAARRSHRQVAAPGGKAESPVRAVTAEEPPRIKRAEAENEEVEARAATAIGAEAENGAKAAESSESPNPTAEEAESEDYLDELEFLESLSLDDPDSFDAVSRMLEDEEDR